MSAGTTRVRSVPSLAVHNREKASRGALTVTTAVVEKIAARVAAQSEGFGAPISSFFGSGSRADFDRGPKVSAVLTPVVRLILRWRLPLATPPPSRLSVTIFEPD